MTSQHNLALSQNFFRRESFVRHLVGMADITGEDLVVEVGPGKGLITDVLANTADRVLAVELDPTLTTELKERFAASETVTIIHADILQWAPPIEAYKVFANIPFNMTADIVRHIIDTNHPPVSAFLVMQRQAALRYIGQPAAPNTQVSILLKPRFDIRVLSDIPVTEFVPTPRVSIVLARFALRAVPLVSSDKVQLFRDFVVYGYNQWKPSLLDGFARVFSGQQRRLLSQSIPLGALSPTQVTFQQWQRLFDVFLQHVPREKQQLVVGAELRLSKEQSRLEKQHRTRQPF